MFFFVYCLMVWVVVVDLLFWFSRGVIMVGMGKLVNNFF